MQYAFILPNGDTFRIDYFNVIRENEGIRIEYLYDGKLIATQEMSVKASQEFIKISFVTGDSCSYQADMKFKVNAEIIDSDSFHVRTDDTHVVIEHYRKALLVLTQRMTIDTAKEIAKEIGASLQEI